MLVRRKARVPADMPQDSRKMKSLPSSSESLQDLRVRWTGILSDNRSRCHPRCRQAIGWLRLVGSLKLKVSFAKEPYERDDILQNRLEILRSLLIVATPYHMTLLLALNFRAPLLFQNLYVSNIHMKHVAQWNVVRTNSCSRNNLGIITFSVLVRERSRTSMNL